MQRDTVGSCDCCGKLRLLSFVNYPPVGDTWACAGCRNPDEPEFDADELFPEPALSPADGTIIAASPDASARAPRPRE